MSERARRGAYGLLVRGVEAADLLVEGDPGWPELFLTVETGRAAHVAENVGDERAVLQLRNGGHISLERSPARARYVVPRPLHAEELVHPYLAPAAAVMAHWLGRESFHAGGVAVDGAVWGVVGDRLAGKSTMLASLALAGHDVVADDLLVLDVGSREVFAGPRSVDLREDAAGRLEAGEGLGVVGARERWRLRLAPLSGRLELCGWVHLGWAETLEVRPIGASDRVVRLAGQRGIRVSPREPAALLDVAVLPSFELRRPRDWASLDRVTAAFLEVVSS